MWNRTGIWEAALGITPNGAPAAALFGTFWDLTAMVPLTGILAYITVYDHVFSVKSGRDRPRLSPRSWRAGIALPVAGGGPETPSLPGSSGSMLDAIKEWGLKGDGEADCSTARR